MDIQPLKPLQESKDTKVNSMLSIPLLSAFFLIITYTLLPQRGWWFDQRDVINSFFVNGVFSFIMMVKTATKKPYSLELMHWIFFYFFFYFAATIQYRIYYFPWGLEPTNAEVLKANWFLLIWGISFSVGTMFARYTKGFRGRTVVGFKTEKIKDFNIIAVAIALYMLVAVGPKNMFSRGSVDSLFSTMEQSMSLVLSHSLRAFIAFNAVFSLIDYQKEKKGDLYLFIAFFCLLLCCFPSSMSRYNAAAIYIGMMVLFFPAMKRGCKFTYIFVFSLMVLFPFMNAFRAKDFFKVDIIQAFRNVFNNMTYSYTEGHYDAYSMMIQTIKGVEETGIYWGKQLLGSIFFFIPRSIWPEKPYGSGHTIMQNLGRDFKNVSEPIPAEMYINFGFVGMILAGFFAGWVLRKIDLIYWERESAENIEKKEYSFLSIFYPFLLSFFFFMMRGDLLSSVAYLTAYIVVGYIMFRIGGLFKKEE